MTKPNTELPLLNQMKAGKKRIMLPKKTTNIAAWCNVSDIFQYTTKDIPNFTTFYTSYFKYLSKNSTERTIAVPKALPDKLWSAPSYE